MTVMLPVGVGLQHGRRVSLGVGAHVEGGLVRFVLSQHLVSSGASEHGHLSRLPQGLRPGLLPLYLLAVVWSECTFILILII